MHTALYVGSFFFRELVEHWDEPTKSTVMRFLAVILDDLIDVGGGGRPLGVPSSLITEYAILEQLVFAFELHWGKKALNLSLYGTETFSSSKYHGLV